MKIISLTQNKCALVDDSDYTFLNQYGWYTHKDKCTCYAVRNVQAPNSKQRRILMHRVILNAPNGIEVDHRNGNGLDNRRSNLRLCTHTENVRHRRLRGKNKTGFKGVTFTGGHKHPYRARIRVNKEEIHLGYYGTAIRAAQVYDLAATKYHGKFALTNEMLGLLGKVIDDRNFIEDCKTMPEDVLRRVKRLALALVLAENQLKGQKVLCDYFVGRAKIAEQKLGEVKL